MEGISWPPIIMIATHLIMSFILFFIMFRIIRKAVQFLFKPVEGLGAKPVSLFLGFGFASMLFSSAVLSTLKNITYFFLFPFRNLQSASPGIIRMTESEKESDWTNFFLNWVSSIYRSLFDLFGNLDYAGIIFLVTFWLLFSLLFEEISRNMREGEKADKIGKLNAFSSNPTLRVVFTLLILFFSIYLSIASIIAVPEFQNRENSSIDKEITQEFKSLIDSQAVSGAEINDLKLQNINLSETAEGLASTAGTFNWVVGLYNASLKEFATNEQELRLAVKEQFIAAVDEKLTVNEANRYKSRLREYYSNFQRRGLENFSSFSERLNDIREKIIETEIPAIDSLDSTQVILPSNNQQDFKAQDFLNQQLYTLESEIERYSDNFRDTQREIPAKPEIGEDWGIFKKVSGWLLKTRSLSLALIVGLFGFGLLGSIGSSFIRQRINIANGKTGDEQILLSDLQGILINGISAAIVVFLAVNGAVVVFTNNGDNSNLNPYVLFFTCLVAAVFSEDVWAWARTKLSDSLGAKTEPPKEEIPEEIPEKVIEDKGKEEFEKPE